MMAAHLIAPCTFALSQPRTATAVKVRFDSDREEALIGLSRRGDENAFTRLIERYRRILFAKAYSILRNPADAEEEVQNTWMQAWTHLESYHGQGSFGAWLGRIVSNQCLMRLRKQKLAPLTSVDQVVESEGWFRMEAIDQRALPDENLGDEEISVTLDKEIRGMPPLLRTVLIMRDVREMDMDSVAGDLGITVPAAKSRLARARHELRDRLEKHLGASGCGTMLRKSRPARIAYVRIA